MSCILPYACRVCKVFLSLEEDDFVYGFDKRDGTTFLICYPCKNDLEKATKGELSREEFGESVKKRWEKEILKINQKIEEARRQGFKVEIITDSRSTETISCCQLVKWFNKLDKKEKALQRPVFLDILSNRERKGNLCYSCSKFCNNLQKQNSSDG